VSPFDKSVFDPSWSFGPDDSIIGTGLLLGLVGFPLAPPPSFNGDEDFERAFDLTSRTSRAADLAFVGTEADAMSLYVAVTVELPNGRTVTAGMQNVTWAQLNAIWDD
jgi:hypothetical protein